MTGTDGSLNGILSLATAAPARALNTTYTPNVARPTLVLATVEIAATTTLLSGDDGQINLVSDLGAPATVRCSMRNRCFQGVGVTVGTVSVIRTVLPFIVPAGWSYRLNSVVLVAAPLFTLVSVTEQTL